MIQRRQVTHRDVFRCEKMKELKVQGSRRSLRTEGQESCEVQSNTSQIRCVIIVSLIFDKKLLKYLELSE